MTSCAHRLRKPHPHDRTSDVHMSRDGCRMEPSFGSLQRHPAHSARCHRRVRPGVTVACLRPRKTRTRTPSAGPTSTSRPTIAHARSLLRSPALATHRCHPPRFSPPRRGTSCRVRLPRDRFDPSGEDASHQHLQPISRPEHPSDRSTLESPGARFRGNDVASTLPRAGFHRRAGHESSGAPLDGGSPASAPSARGHG